MLLITTLPQPVYNKNGVDDIIQNNTNHNSDTELNSLLVVDSPVMLPSGQQQHRSLVKTSTSKTQDKLIDGNNNELVPPSDDNNKTPLNVLGINGWDLTDLPFQPTAEASSQFDLSLQEWQHVGAKNSNINNYDTSKLIITDVAQKALDDWTLHQLTNDNSEAELLKSNIDLGGKHANRE